MLIDKIKNTVKINRIRLNEFFEDFDPLRKGTCTKAKFRTALDMANLHLRAEEFDVLEKFFSKARSLSPIYKAKFLEDYDDFKRKAKLRDIEEILDMIEENPLLDGITFSGGDPMDQAAALIPLAREIKERGMNLVIFTGYTYERLMDLAHVRPEMFELLTFADILIDGPFILAKRSLEIKFRGSTNQRIIDVQQSLVEGHVVLHQIQLDEMKTRPELVTA